MPHDGRRFTPPAKRALLLACFYCKIVHNYDLNKADPQIQRALSHSFRHYDVLAGRSPSRCRRTAQPPQQSDLDAVTCNLTGGDVLACLARGPGYRGKETALVSTANLKTHPCTNSCKPRHPGGMDASNCQGSVVCDSQRFADLQVGSFRRR